MLRNLQQISFASPWALLLLVFPAAFIAWNYLAKRRLYPYLNLPALEGVKGKLNPFRGVLKNNLFWLRVLSATLFIIALARPQTSFNEEEINTEGIDIIISLDISASMLARDFQPDRLEAAKAKAADFINSRPNDRIGLVVFAGESFTQCPMTIDHDMLLRMLDEIKYGLIEDGTAIGMGLANAVSRIKDSPSKSKVVILLTDGVNNAGFIDPSSASDAAIQYGIRVYTVGVGRTGTAPYPVQTPFGTSFQEMEVEIDEELLTEIAGKTGGKYFRANNNQALENVYQEIDKMEKSRIQVTRISRTGEVFHPFLILGGILFLLEILLRYFVVKYIP